jgi:hypothetical protein
MKHTIEHTCGHPAEHDLNGSPGFQAWEAKRRAAGPCPICYRAEVDSENALNAAFAAEQALPDLAGTPRQVAWAVSIRADFLGQLPHLLAGLRKAVAGQGGAELPGPDEALAVIRESTCRETSAPWWIRNRDRIADSLRQRHHVRLRSGDPGDPGETAGRLLVWAGRR